MQCAFAGLIGTRELRLCVAQLVLEVLHRRVTLCNLCVRDVQLGLRGDVISMRSVWSVWQCVGEM